MKNLKRIVLCLTMVMAFAMPSMAQFKIGPRIGIEANKMHFNSDLFNSDNRAGFTGGLQLEFMVPAINLGLDASVMYVRRTGEVPVTTNTDGSVSTTGEATTNRDYIAVPINLKWKIGVPLISSILRPFVFTGPEFAFLTSRRAITEAWRNKSTDVSWNFGVGLEFFNHLQIAASYGMGLTKAASYVGLTSSKDDQVNGKNRYWTVTAAYLF